MQSRWNSQPRADAGVEIVTGPNLKEAYRKVRLMYGEDAAILGTRTVTMRSANGLGQEKMVEVTLGKAEAAKPGLPPAARTPARDSRGAAEKKISAMGEPALQQAISAELDRIDGLMAEISRDLQESRKPAVSDLESGLGGALAAAGTSGGTIARLAQRYAAESGQEFQDGPRARQWLARQIPAADCGWDGFFGCHAFLGYARPQRLELVLSTCARFQEMGRKTLLLIMLPEHEGTIKRLQVEAARYGYDAAIIRNPDQLQRCREHFDQYDAVLLEMPDLDAPVMSESPVVHDWLAGNAGFHRHLVVPLDYDLADGNELTTQGRHWNCDWLAVSRPARFKRTGKLLDILEKMPLPVSLAAYRTDNRTEVEIAHGDALLGAVLTDGSPEMIDAVLNDIMPGRDG